MDNPGRVHQGGVKHVFRYLAGMRNWALIYGTKVKGLEGFTDVDGATQEHRYAITRYAFLIDGGAISWSSKKQEIVMLSTLSRPKFEFPYMVYKYVHAFYRLATGLGATLQ